MDPTVSILIPTYNRAGYLREAIKSALAQTYQNIEVLVLDDASPDETPQVVAEFSADPRLRYLRHPKNLGIVGNWRAGIAAAAGDFFCLLHDDDTFEPAFVETLIDPLREDAGLILSFSDHWITDAAGGRSVQESDDSAHRFGRDRLTCGRLDDFARSALIDGSIPVGACLFRRCLIPQDALDDRAKGSVDAWLFYQCVRTGCGAYYIPERLMNYRTHPASMSGGMTVYMAEGHLFRYRAMLKDAAMAHLSPQIRRGMVKTLNDYGIDLITQGDSAMAKRPLRESLRIRPSLRGLTAFALAYSGRLGVRITASLRAEV